jgi:ATP-dependent RNA helicase DDX42
MGWFDEDDDSEEEQTTAKKQSNQAAGEDEDTLDAFMKTLDANATHRAPRAERLDVENADEATSHWTECAVEKRTSEEDEEDDPTRASQQALESMFHKAGAAANDEENGPRRDYTDEIQLEQVEHDKMDYEDFTRVFYKYCDTAAGQEWRRQHHVTCNPQSFDPVTSFDEISDILQGPLRQVISKSNYVTPTPVQAQTLAVALSGRDAIVTASTGSGKTLAYVWPMCVHICHQRHLDKGEGPIAVVLVPTRELCLQVHKQCQIMIGALKGKAVAITGGTNRYQLVQEFAKNGSEIVVATPGRFLDILSIKKNGITLKRVTMVVLDECDRMLDMGFEKQVTQLLKNVRPDRQSLLLSATLGRKVERVARQWLSNPIR